MNPRAGIACGLAAPLLWAACIAGFGALRPDYSPITQFISELGERGGPTEFPMRYGGFVFTGALYVPFALVMYRRFGAVAAAALVALGGMLRVVAGVYPCDLHCGAPLPSPDQIIHNLAARAGFLALIAATLLGARLFRREPAYRSLAAYSSASGLASFACLVLIGIDPPHQGLFQRLSTGILSLWVFVVAATMWREPVRT
ncbi:MAG: DUF998 domain-containing protein [Gammaproteobacteria bacterium]|nr:DUF998 domain-containing protein [Gammaproteobacteria bacterium]MBI5618694.1 DUF998 domain-containing protein [Gammaproteobacteria bacterium]